MKKTILSLTFIFFSSIIAHAQWNTNGTVTSTTNSVALGVTNTAAQLSLGPSTGNKKLFIYDAGNEASGFGQGNSEFRIFGISSGFNHISFGKYDLTVDGFTEQMRIDNAGNLAIGATDSKGYKLAVNGSAIATAVFVKLYSAWPDYVFKPTYQLRPLTEVKEYIDQNQHLPEIPSADEIAKEGLNLGEMNKLLLKKVEELTLYIIEKDSQLDQQKKKLRNQEWRIRKLENVVRGK